MQLPISRYQGSSALVAAGFMAQVLVVSTLACAQDSSQVVQRYSYTVADESPVIYDIVASAAIEALPGSLQTELLELQNAIRSASLASLFDKTNSTTTDSRADEHYLILDASVIVADTLDAEFNKQLMAARTFPKDRRQARQLFQKLGLRHGGLLPWVLVDHHTALKAAFVSQQTEAVVQEIAAVVHYSADAAMAFHVTGNRFATVVAKEASIASQKNSSQHKANTWWQGELLYKRCQVELLEWSRDRFEHETRVWPGRIKPIKDPIDMVFETMTQAYEIGFEMSALDRKVCASLAINNEQDFSKRSDAYYVALSERAGYLHRLQLETGTLLAARLITDAWQHTGRLSVSQLPATTNHPILAKEESSLPVTETIVGSKNSHIFHRSSCPYVKRIARENLVPFDSAQAAKDQGRRPCRTCHP